KIAMGWYLDGRVTAVVGTHTHVQTADNRVLPKGTAYLTDVGMTGPHDGAVRERLGRSDSSRRDRDRRRSDGTRDGDRAPEPVARHAGNAGRRSARREGGRRARLMASLFDLPFEPPEPEPSRPTPPTSAPRA